MALNPSDNVSGGFPTIGDPPFDKDGRDRAIAELKAAGIPRGSEIVTSRELKVLNPESERYRLAQAGIHIPHRESDGEDTVWVDVYEVEAKAFGWKFRRAWCYWIAEADLGGPLPASEAFELHDMCGNTVRVDGHCGAPPPTGPTDHYHVDAPDGLAALVQALETQHQIHKDA